MKYLLTITAALCCWLVAAAHITVNLPQSEVETIKNLVHYERDANGYWQSTTKTPGFPFQGVAYALDEKANVLYVKTMSGNFEVLLTKDAAKKYKKNGQLRKVTGSELVTLILDETKKLNDSFGDLNERRRKFVTDSIATAQRADRERQEAAELQRLKARSGKQADVLPTSGFNFRCLQCGNEVKNRESLKIKGITNNRIYHLDTADGPLGTKYQRMHVYAVRPDLAESTAYRDHLRIFGDEVTNGFTMTDAEIIEFNKKEGRELRDRVSQVTPYGYISDVVLTCGQGMGIEFYFTNTNPSPVSKAVFEIEYDDEYGNPATASFTLNGPIKQFDEVAYENPSTKFPCFGEGRNMKLTVTYTNGTKVVLLGDDLYIDRTAQ